MWSKKVRTDKFFRDAKVQQRLQLNQNYVSRAAFKLLEIQKKHRLIKHGSSVLDLGCAPGAWLQAACQQLGPESRGGQIIGVDIQDMELPTAHIDSRVHFLKADVLTLTPTTLYKYSPMGFDAILSDMLHFTSGNATLDVAKSLQLTSAALDLAVGYYCDIGTNIGKPHDGVLRYGGHLLMKIYEGSGTNDFLKDVKPYFENMSRVRPEATRKTSREFYLVCKDRKKRRLKETP